MSLIKTKFKKINARRRKLSIRNKIEYLNNKIKKLVSEKKVLAKKLLNNQEDSATKVEQLGDKLKSEEQKIDDLKKTVECPVCLEVPRKGPVFICPNGHLVCQKCKRNSCPTCREAIGDNKTLLAVTVIEKILHDCKFTECEEKFPLNHIEEHEKVCKHRIVSCPDYFDCVQRVPLSKLLTHLETSPDCCITSTPLVVNEYGSSTATRYFLFIKSTLEEKMQEPVISWTVKTYCFEGHFFALTAKKSGSYWQFLIVMFESPEVCSKFNIEMQVYETSSSDTRLSVKTCCHPCSIDQTVAEMEGWGLVVHHKFMKEIILKEDGTGFTVSFSFL